MSDDSAEKKLHVDADWKEQVRAEKERLAREKPAAGQTSTAAGAKAGSGATGDAVGDRAGGADEGDRRPLPPATFEGFVETLAAQALLFLTPQKDPESGATTVNLDLAKHTIDLLGVLEEKTRGNLTDGETKALDAALYQARMAYVQLAR
jgi:hypothetical protein